MWLFRWQTKGLVPGDYTRREATGRAAVPGRTCWCWKMVQQPDVPPTTANDNFSSSFTVSYAHANVNVYLRMCWNISSIQLSPVAWEYTAELQTCKVNFTIQIPPHHVIRHILCLVCTYWTDELECATKWTSLDFMLLNWKAPLHVVPACTFVRVRVIFDRTGWGWANRRGF